MGDFCIVLTEQQDLRPPQPLWRRGLRYLDFHVDDVVSAFASALDHGGKGFIPPLRVGDRLVFSCVQTVGGTWLELIQLAEDAGRLPDVPAVETRLAELEEFRQAGRSLL